MSVAVKLQPEELRVEVVEGRDGFVQLEKAWNAALGAGPHDEPMLRHEWMRAYIENFAPGATLRTFVARAGREIAAAVPLIETGERSADTCFVPMTTWALPVNDHSQRGGLLLGRGWQAGLDLIWERLQQEAGWDRLRLRDLPGGAPDWRLRELAEKAGHPCGLWVSLRSPYLALPKKYADVEAALEGKFRQNLRRRKRRLAELGQVEYELTEGDDALADFFDIEASGWKGKDVVVALRLEVLTIAWMIVEAGVSIAAGVVAKSLLLLAFGADSGRELVGIEGGDTSHQMLGDRNFREFGVHGRS